MNTGFEHDLTKALKRLPPPDGFTDRVMARLPRRRFQPQKWWAAVAAGMVVIAAAGGLERNRHDREVRAEQAHQQVVFALSLASEKVDHALNRANSRLQRSAPDITIGEEKGHL